MDVVGSNPEVVAASVAVAVDVAEAVAVDVAEAVEEAEAAEAEVEEAEEAEAVEAQRSSSFHTDTRASSSPEANRTCWSLRTSYQARKSMAKTS